ncbi:hypothetical protein BV20DRAFT_1039134 [Pilatotrama ljubarskyi]|nr:hypothetical protein BV20DRAFT_1039134 [Pilatotrama ljubarskyi]
MKTFCPLPGRFAVIRMDPVGMVKHYEDPIALAAAQAMRAKKYLVYLHTALDMPTPTNPWFRFEVCPIGTTLRPANEDEGITPDMAIPIYPNTSHPQCRPPIRTEDPFPFPNCYYWIRNYLTVRIRRKATRYDDAHAVAMGDMQDMRLESSFREDYARINAFHREKLASAADASFHGVKDPRETFTPAQDAGTPDSNVIHMGADDFDLLREGSAATDHTRSSATSSGSSASVCSEPSSDDPIAAIMQMDIFGFNVDDTVELMPLVDLWFELTDHLTAETIPSPVELYKEWDTIMQ